VHKPEEIDHSEDRGVDGRMGSEWILGRLAGGWSGFSWLRIGTGRGSCQYGNEPSVGHLPRRTKKNREKLRDLIQDSEPPNMKQK
jgi:hypothetical protein